MTLCRFSRAMLSASSCSLRSGVGMMGCTQGPGLRLPVPNESGPVERARVMRQVHRHARPQRRGAGS